MIQERLSPVSEFSVIGIGACSTLSVIGRMTGDASGLQKVVRKGSASEQAEEGNREGRLTQVHLGCESACRLLSRPHPLSPFIIIITQHECTHLPSQRLWKADVVICLEQGANDLHMVQLMPLTRHHLNKIQNGLIFLVPAYPGSPGQWP